VDLSNKNREGLLERHRDRKVVGSVSGGQCNLRQFLYYISDNQEKATIADKTKLKDRDLAKEMTALDEVASKLYRADVGRNYQHSRIYEISDIVAAPID
jgi:hypothetical protein